jgi:hypothetical protein
MARDGSSGGVIRTVVVTKDGAVRGFVPGEAVPFRLEETVGEFSGIPIPEAPGLIGGVGHAAAAAAAAAADGDVVMH